MLYTIGILIFWITILGYSTLLYDKTKIKQELSIPLVFAIITCVVYLMGLLNILVLGTISIYLSGIIIFIYYLFRSKNILKAYFNNNNLIFLAFILLFITIFFKDLHLEHYDNFSHWAVIVQDMFNKNQLPNFESTLIEFQAYQPGTACFIYFFGFLFSKTEGIMIVAQNYLFVVFLSGLLLLIKNRHQLILRVLFLSLLIYMAVGNIPFYDLLVDVTLSVVFISGLVFAYEYRDDLKKLFYCFLFISIFLFLIKNSGIIFGGFNCLILLYLSFKYNKKDWHYGILLGIVLLLNWYVWQQHVIYAYGISGLNAHHAMSLQNFISSLQMKGIDGIKQFVIVYIKHFFDIKNNICNLFMLFINVMFISMLFVFSKLRKNILKVLVFSDLMYFGYYCILGAMYLLSMTLNGALGLAGFDRYMYTVIFIILGIVFMTLALIFYKNYNLKSVYIYSLILIIIFNLLIFGYKKTDITVFMGNQNYDNSFMYKFDQLKLEMADFKISENDIYYVYFSKIDESGYYRYLARYKLQHNYVRIFNNFDQIDTETEATYVLFLEDDLEIKEQLVANNYLDLSENVYVKNND